jgi:TATA-box binding protein (TBP) (component of TFIID and TFIIIB)
MNEPTFTDFEWIAIENALEALLTHLDEMADPEFSVALENIVCAYDLDENMEKEVVNQYDDLNDIQYSDFV